MSQICRTCLTETLELRTIYKAGKICGQVISLAEMLKFCTKLNISNDDGLPSKICYNCVKHVSKSYAFIQLCIQSDRYLHTNQEETENLEEVEEYEEDGESEEGDAIVESPKKIKIESLVEQSEHKVDAPQTKASDSITEFMFYIDQNNQLEEEIQDVEYLDEPEQQQINQNEFITVSATNQQENVDKPCDPTTIQNVYRFGSDDGEEAEEEEDAANELYNIKEVSIDDVKKEAELSIQQSQEEILLHESEQAYINLNKYEQKKSKIKIKQKDEENDLTSDGISKLPKMVLRRNHQRRPKDHPGPPYSCTICLKTLSNYSSYKYHMQLHSENTPFLCSDCGEGFKTRNAYDGHMITHAVTNPHTCKMCGKSYRQAASLRCHMLIHSGDKPFTCSICGKGMTQKSGFKKHMLTHTGEKPYECDLCGKEFRFSSNMIMHKKSHSGEKPYSCDVCNKRFIGTENLKRHKQIHTGEKPFSCDVCGKAFSRKSTLQVHQNIHLLDRKQECPICGKAYIQEHCLKLHIASHADDSKDVAIEMLKVEIDEEEDVVNI